MALLIQWNRKHGERNFINKYLVKIRLLFHHNYVMPMFLKIKFIIYSTKTHTILVKLLDNFLSDFLKFNYNVTIFTEGGPSNEFARGLRWHSYATDLILPPECRQGGDTGSALGGFINL